MSIVTSPGRRSAKVASLAEDLERIRLEHRAQRIEYVLGRMRHRPGPAARQPAGRLASELATELKAIQARLDELSSRSWY